jgi:transcriptional regulator with XRE-family HTH domain
MGQRSMTPAQCRMARAAVAWTVRELAERAGVHKNTILRIEAGLASHGPTIAAVQRTLEEAGLAFIEPEEGVTEPGVAPRWGVTLPEAGSRGAEAGLPDDGGLKALNADAEEMAAYWRERPAEWMALSPAGRDALTVEMFGWDDT